MAFRVSKTRTFSAPVNVGAENFTAHFHALSDEELQTFDGEGAEKQKDFLRRSVARLDGLLGDDDKPLPYSAEVLEEMISYPDLRIAMLIAHNSGLWQAKAGN